MTAFFTATQAIISRLKTQWAAIPRTEPIFTANEGRETDASPSTGFLVAEVLFGTAFQASIGSGLTGNKFRHPGVIFVHILAPSDAGQGAALEFADLVTGIFRGQQFSGVTCGDYSVQPGGKQELEGNGNWYMLTVSIDFYFDANF